MKQDITKLLNKHSLNSINELKKTTGNTLLQDAFLKNDNNLFEKLLLSGVNVNQKNKDGSTILTNFILSIKKMTKVHLQKITKLLNSGANINDFGSNGMTVLQTTYLQKNFEIFYHLLDFGALINAVSDHDETLLFMVLNNVFYTMNNNDFTEKSLLELISLGASVDYYLPSGITMLQDAFLKDDDNVIKFLLTHGAKINHLDNSGMTALHCSLFTNNKKMFKKLLTNGADINACDETGLNILTYLIIGKCDTYDVEYDVKKPHDVFKIENLIKVGADINTVDKYGMSQFLTVVRSNNVKFVKETTDKKEGDSGLMIVNKGNVKAAQRILTNEFIKLNKNDTPIMVDIMKYVNVHIQKLTKSYKSPMLELLLKHGFDFNAVDKFGNTVFHSAYLYQQDENAIKWLLKHGFKQQRNNCGLEPHQMKPITSTKSSIEADVTDYDNRQQLYNKQLKIDYAIRDEKVVKVNLW